MPPGADRARKRYSRLAAKMFTPGQVDFRSQQVEGRAAPSSPTRSCASMRRRVAQRCHGCRAAHAARFDLRRHRGGRTRKLRLGRLAGAGISPAPCRPRQVTRAVRARRVSHTTGADLRKLRYSGRLAYRGSKMYVYPAAVKAGGRASSGARFLRHSARHCAVLASSQSGAEMSQEWREIGSELRLDIFAPAGGSEAAAGPDGRPRRATLPSSRLLLVAVALSARTLNCISFILAALLATSNYVAPALAGDKILLGSHIGFATIVSIVGVNSDRAAVSFRREIDDVVETCARRDRQF